ncbi:hypothetical protein Nepgr_004556 [Nepenthes gracilis]|uniref:Homing endonuclease LAGLIDADG domain-containing protein n=1 Tax=Nepenthes gracilis TaxID=150966 RepID=A0AAD3S1K3_NEPGR|nr:hypothetical protein Nepgr_004556 [Nepenthes gracilis]
MLQDVSSFCFFLPLHLSSSNPSPSSSLRTSFRSTSHRRFVRPLIPSYSASLPSLASQICLLSPRRIPPSLCASSSVSSCTGTSVEQLVGETDRSHEPDGYWDLSTGRESSEGGFDFGKCFESSAEQNKLAFSSLSLEELPENWRRSKLAWLCKELPAHRRPTMTRVLNAQKKWMRQEDATYIAVHLMRIRKNEAAFCVYKWMTRQHWFRFDFVLITKLAEYLGREKKSLKSREMFDGIINQGRVPCESTFHILVVAYLSSTGEDCLHEACGVYNRMIQLGGYSPPLSLHNSLFRALVRKPGIFAKHYLKQAEFIFHNLVTTGLDIHKDIYCGLIWLHSYQDSVDKQRISSLRKEMQLAGVEESGDVLLSILRACSKGGDVAEAEQTWLRLRHCDGAILSQAFVYKMEVYAKIGEHQRSLEVFKEMKVRLGSANVEAYHKIVEVMCDAQEIDIAESLMKEFTKTGLKPLTPSYINMMNMYYKLSLHDKVESAFTECLEKCHPDRTLYSIYLDSAVQTNSIEKAEKVFNHMLKNGAIGVNSRSCNSILRGYLCCQNHAKAEQVYYFMCRKKYKIDSPLLEEADYILSLSRKTLKKATSMELSQEQREILVGLLLGGLRVELDEDRRQHFVCFEFKDSSSTQFVLKRHIYDKYHEWLHPSNMTTDDSDDIPCRFSTIAHAYFGFYADQFWPEGRQTIPKLIHRWLCPRVLAYWYMHSGQRTSTGDIFLKLRGSRDGVERVVKALKTMSLGFKVKQKGKVFWLAFQGGNSTCFWKLTEPYILDDLKERVEADGQSYEARAEAPNISVDSESEYDESLDS